MVPKYRSTSVYTSSYIKHRTVQCKAVRELVSSCQSALDQRASTSRKSQSVRLEHVAH